MISIPRSYMGQTLQESVVKRGLLELCPELHFDLGGRHDIWYPFKDTRQSVFHGGKFICAMDRGTLPELPIWTMKRDLLEVPWSDVKSHELAMHTTEEVRCSCLKCKHSWQMKHRPEGVVFCPNTGSCGNVGQATDATRFAWENVFTGSAWVWRQVRDRIVLVGWRHTFCKLLRGTIPGISQPALELKFKIDLMPRVLDPLEITEQHEETFLDRRLVL